MVFHPLPSPPSLPSLSIFSLATDRQLKQRGGEGRGEESEGEGRGEEEGERRGRRGKERGGERRRERGREARVHNLYIAALFITKLILQFSIVVELSRRDRGFQPRLCCSEMSLFYH